jgi:hypothetical protein
MTSETRTKTGSLHYDERLHPSFPRPAIASSDSDEVLKLRTDNARLQRLVAELLVENQQLRQRDTAAPAPAPDSTPDPTPAPTPDPVETRSTQTLQPLPSLIAAIADDAIVERCGSIGGRNWRTEYLRVARCAQIDPRRISIIWRIAIDPLK